MFMQWCECLAVTLQSLRMYWECCHALGTQPAFFAGGFSGDSQLHSGQKAAMKICDPAASKQSTPGMLFSTVLMIPIAVKLLDPEGCKCFVLVTQLVWALLPPMPWFSQWWAVPVILPNQNRAFSVYVGVAVLGEVVYRNDARNSSSS